MFRGSIVFAASIVDVKAQFHTRSNHFCGDCNLDLSALEEFTSDYNLVMGMGRFPVFTTTALPPNMPSDHGTVAVHARNLQVKLDNRFEIPADFHFPRPNPILNQLLGHEIQEELHINGVNGQASFHLASPVLNACIQVDVPPPHINHAMMEQHLQQAQQLATIQVQHMGHHVTVDGEEGVAMVLGGRDENHGAPLVLTNDSHPIVLAVARVGPDAFAALKFSNYVNSVGNAFAVRACEVEAQSSTQAMLAANPEVREYIGQRIADHQNRLQALLEPESLNTRYNFVPLQVAELMMANVHDDCTHDVLAETAPMAASTSQTLVVFAVGSFVTGVVATFAAMRKKATSTADTYYQVSA